MKFNLTFLVFILIFQNTLFSCDSCTKTAEIIHVDLEMKIIDDLLIIKNRWKLSEKIEKNYIKNYDIDFNSELNSIELENLEDGLKTILKENGYFINIKNYKRYDVIKAVNRIGSEFSNFDVKSINKDLYIEFLNSVKVDLQKKSEVYILIRDLSEIFNFRIKSLKSQLKEYDLKYNIDGNALFISFNKMKNEKSESKETESSNLFRFIYYYVIFMFIFSFYYKRGKFKYRKK